MRIFNSGLSQQLTPQGSSFKMAKNMPRGLVDAFSLLQAFVDRLDIEEQARYTRLAR